MYAIGNCVQGTETWQQYQHTEMKYFTAFVNSTCSLLLRGGNIDSTSSRTLCSLVPRLLPLRGPTKNTGAYQALPLRIFLHRVHRGEPGNEARPYECREAVRASTYQGYCSKAYNSLLLVQATYHQNILPESVLTAVNSSQTSSCETASPASSGKAVAGCSRREDTELTHRSSHVATWWR